MRVSQSQEPYSPAFSIHCSVPVLADQGLQPSVVNGPKLVADLSLTNASQSRTSLDHFVVKRSSTPLLVHITCQSVAAGPPCSRDASNIASFI